MQMNVYDPSTLPPRISTFLDNINTTSTTTPGDGDLDLFFHCWTKPHCPACLSPSNKYPCSWCATSQTCVPNTVFEYPFGILSPLKTDELCPLGWRERWELRARPFSCRCSSMTFVSVVVAVLATLLSLSLILLTVRLGRWAGRRWRARQKGWWRLRNWIPRWLRKEQRDTATQSETIGPAQAPTENDERTPLLA